jgi:hypothetical protein
MGFLPGLEIGDGIAGAIEIGRPKQAENTRFGGLLVLRGKI